MTRTIHGLPGIYNSSALSLSNGDGAALAIDSAGRLIIGGSGTEAVAAPTSVLVVGGVYNSSAPTYSTGQATQLQSDVNGNLKVTNATLLAGEDLTNNKMVVEHQYTPSGVLLTDTQIKASAGFVHTVTISQNDAAPTAGTIDLYNNTAGSGTKIFTWTLTTAVFNPFTVTLDMVCSTGIYLDFTTTADVAVSVSYR